MAAPTSSAEVKRANVRYHDLAAEAYDEKWGISYCSLGQDQVVAKLARALGVAPTRFERGLEIGAGTGYFGLNLVRAGVLDEMVATDISPGMLRKLERSASELGLEVETVAVDASDLPFRDESFDLVFGHAVLHHLPDLDRAFAELGRVLRPGGVMAFCGEPSRYGDRLAAIPKRAAVLAAPAWRRLLRVPARDAAPGDGRSDPNGAAAPAAGTHGPAALQDVRRANGGAPEAGEEQFLEWVVDVHAFTPGDLERHARAAGFDSVRVSGEELAASWFGWMNRTLEGSAAQGELPRLWYRFAQQGYLALQRVDRALLEPRLPAALFYNLLLSARKPG